MSKQLWFAEIQLSTDVPLELEAILEATERLQPYAGAVSVAQDGSSAGATLAVTATCAKDAAVTAEDAVRLAFHPAAVATLGLSVKTEALMQLELAQPQIPELVGYIEIAGMAGVSRQRARQFAGLPGFPPVAVETAAGPLRLKSAVQAWVANRNRLRGRPPKVTATA